MQGRWIKWLGAAAVASSLMTACGGEEAQVDAGEEFEFFDSDVLSGKGDMAQRAHIVDEIDLRSEIKGSFKPGYRVYGYVFEAKTGAVVEAHVKARGGADSVTSPDEDLAMIMGVYGPMEGGAPGPRLAYVDQSGEPDGRLPAIEIPEDGKYMVVFSTWDDPGTGTYVVSLGCDGTDFQCQRPVVDRPCDEETLYIEGGAKIAERETWSACEVVLLEPTTIPAESILTIEPGVVVKGNFLGEGDYGDVQLIVEGHLQAIGTEANPIVFTALRDGWGGVVLKNSSNHLEHVFVEKAATGVTIAGAENNVLRNININTSKVGIELQADGAAQIEDIVLTGLKDAKVGSGIVGRNAAPSTFVRSFVSGFHNGIDLNSSEFEFIDSTITGNVRGVVISGTPRGLHEYPFQCPRAPERGTAPSRPVWTPSSFGIDPHFLRCDIIDNSEVGLYIDAPELLVIEHSNIKGNGKGIEIHSTALHPESRIQHSNIYGNGDNPQVDAWHASGVLDISSNYWNAISDPELSASWLVEHTVDHRCETSFRANNISDNRGWTCNRSNYQSSTRTYQYTCHINIEAGWEGEVTFTGFSPRELDADPEVEVLADPVQQARQASGI